MRNVGLNPTIVIAVSSLNVCFVGYIFSMILDIAFSGMFDTNNE